MIEQESPPADRHLELASDLPVASLVVLERLAPEERAAFLLREVFDCGYPEIAVALGRNEAGCRQMVHRARERVRRDRPRFQVSEAARTRLLEKFAAALHARDQQTLLGLFAADATWTSDGGGKVKVSQRLVPHVLVGAAADERHRRATRKSIYDYFPWEPCHATTYRLHPGVPPTPSRPCLTWRLISRTANSSVHSSI